MDTPLPSSVRLRIASPCPADWSAMAGDERRRFCQACSRHVHNVSAMTEREIATLVGTPAGRVCIRVYRRADGTVLTADCPVGRQARHRERARRVGMAAALLALWAATERAATQARALVGWGPAVGAALVVGGPSPQLPSDGEWLAGEMMPPPGDDAP